MRNIRIILLLFIIIPFQSYGQLDEALQLSGKSFAELKQPISSFQLLSNYKKPYRISSISKQSIVAEETSSVLCQKYEGKAHTAFFCRMEDKLDKKVRFPIRVRLGDLNYVNHLEMKNSYIPDVNY